MEDDVRDIFVGDLLVADEVPVDAAKASLDSENSLVVEVAAHLLGRAGQQGDSLAAKLGQSHSLWAQEREQAREGVPEADDRAERILTSLHRLIWACMRTGSGEDEILACANDPTEDEAFLPVRLTALQALGELESPSPAAIEAISATLTDSSAPVREIGTLVLAQQAPDQATAKGEALLSDRTNFNLVAERSRDQVAPVLQSGGSHAHYQPIVLPHLIAGGDGATLATVAADDSLPETTRLGAIEGLAAIATEATEDELAKLGKAEAMDEELRKAAWRGLRRSKRQRAKHS